MGNSASFMGSFIILIIKKPLRENNATNCVDLRIKKRCQNYSPTQAIVST